MGIREGGGDSGRITSGVCKREREVTPMKLQEFLTEDT